MQLLRGAHSAYSFWSPRGSCKFTFEQNLESRSLFARTTPFTTEKPAGRRWKTPLLRRCVTSKPAADSHATAHGFLPPPMRMRPAGFLHPPAIFADGVTTLAGGNGTARTPPSSRFGAANPTGDSLPPPFGFAPPGRSVAAPVATVATVGRLPPRENGRFHILTRDQFARPSDHAPGQREAGKPHSLIETGENGKSGCFAGIFDHFILLRYRFSGFPVSIRALFPGERLKIEPFGRDLDAWKGFLVLLAVLRRRVAARRVLRACW